MSDDDLRRLEAFEDLATEADVVATVVGALPGCDVLGMPMRVPKGFGNESWRVGTSVGALVVKIRRQATDAAKLRSQVEAVRLAWAAGVPTAELLHVGESEAVGGRIVTILRYVPGVDAEEAVPLLDQAQRAALFGDLGDAVGRLHGIGLPHFTERLGTPEAVLADWSAVVTRTARRAAAWNRPLGVLAAAEIAMLHDELVRAVAGVTGVVTPALTHRDVYLANLLVADGRLAAIIDFELAKGYDPLLDFVKLGMFIFERWPESLAPFMAPITGGLVAWCGSRNGYTSAWRWSTSAWYRIGGRSMRSTW